jgi:hypothetical protein
MDRGSASLTRGITRTPQIDESLAPSGDSFAATFVTQEGEIA